MNQREVANQLNAGRQRRPVAQANPPVVAQPNNAVVAKPAPAVQANANVTAKPVANKSTKPKVPMDSIRIKKIGVVSLANVYAMVNVIIGLLIGLIFTILSFVGTSVEGTETGTLAIVFGMFAILIFPIALGIMGWISGALTAILYNLGSKITNGIKLYS